MFSIVKSGLTACLCNTPRGNPLGGVHQSPKLPITRLRTPPVPWLGPIYCLSPGGCIPVCQQRWQRPLHRPGRLRSRLRNRHSSLRVERELAQWLMPYGETPNANKRVLYQHEGTAVAAPNTQAPELEATSSCWGHLKDNPVPVSLPTQPTTAVTSITHLPFHLLCRGCFLSWCWPGSSFPFT